MDMISTQNDVKYGVHIGGWKMISKDGPSPSGAIIQLRDFYNGIGLYYKFPTYKSHLSERRDDKFRNTNNYTYIGVVDIDYLPRKRTFGLSYSMFNWLDVYAGYCAHDFVFAFRHGYLRNGNRAFNNADIEIELANEREQGFELGLAITPFRFLSLVADYDFKYKNLSIGATAGWYMKAERKRYTRKKRYRRRR